MYLKNLMKNYLNENNKFEVQNSFRPLEVKKSKWLNIDNKKTKKVYSFESQKFFELFIVEVLKFSRECKADIELRFRDFKVGIIIHSYSGKLSELELEASKDIDKIKKDVMYYYADEK